MYQSFQIQKLKYWIELQTIQIGFTSFSKLKLNYRPFTTTKFRVGFQGHIQNHHIDRRYQKTWCCFAHKPNVRVAKICKYPWTSSHPNFPNLLKYRTKNRVKGGFECPLHMKVSSPCGTVKKMKFQSHLKTEVSNLCII
jgi:hypothetical protein